MIHLCCEADLKLNPGDFIKLVDKLASGGVVIMPTDTLYGLFCDALNPHALERVCKIKGRPAGRPMPVAVSGTDQAAGLVSTVSTMANNLMKKFWPGALTLVLPAKDGLPGEIVMNGGVGVRMPDHSLVLEVLRAVKCPLVATSANLTGEVAPVSLDDISPSVLGQVDYVINAGPLRTQNASTVLDLTTNIPRIIREGIITHSVLSLAIDPSHPLEL